MKIDGLQVCFYLVQLVVKYALMISCRRSVAIDELTLHLRAQYQVAVPHVLRLL
mgnify:CR=1 FL=1